MGAEEDLLAKRSESVCGRGHPGNYGSSSCAVQTPADCTAAQAKGLVKVGRLLPGGRRGLNVLSLPFTHKEEVSSPGPLLCLVPGQHRCVFCLRKMMASSPALE